MQINGNINYKCVKFEQVFTVKHNVSNNKLIKDEELIIICLKNVQLDNACLTGKEVRNIASELSF